MAEGGILKNHLTAWRYI